MKDFAFIHYNWKKDAEKALKQLNGTILGGHVLEVTWAKPKVLDVSKMQVSEDSRPIKKKSIMRKDIEEWSISQECLKHVAPPTFVPSVRSIHNTPVQILDYVCIQNGFGEPYYLIYQSVTEEILTFTSKVFIPYLPLWENSFVSDCDLPSPFEAKCFAATKALKYMGFSDNDYIVPEVPFTSAVKYPSCRSIASVPHSLPPIRMNIGQEPRHCHELAKAPTSYSDLWNFPKENEIVTSKKSDSVSIYDLLPAAAVLAYRELEACSSKQK